jgi:hypothetical protein
MSDAGGALRRAALGLAAVGALTACFRGGGVATVLPRWNSELAALTLFGDSGITDTIAPGALHRSFVVTQGPWAVHVLDIDREACWAPLAVKGAAGAAGRTKTSALTASLAAPGTVVAGGVNADFFLFNPPGVPTGAHVSGASVVTGPGVRPVFATDTAGRTWIGMLSVTGFAVAGRDSVAITAWNRVAPAGVAWMDARYGTAVDTLSGSVRIVLAAMRGTVESVDASLTPTRIPSSGGVLVLGPRAPASVSGPFLRAARLGVRLDVNVRLNPIHPQEAVGGFPVLVRDSLEVPGLDSAGAANFAPVRHPRTIVGVAANGRRLLLITIDGRQPGYSVGTTNRESARVALALGATQALNLDGGGSTAMALARYRGNSPMFEVVNRPSDPTGERAVGNALVIARKSSERGYCTAAY